MQTFVIGDLHGGLKALKEVLEKVPYKPQDLFIFLGDYVDGWSDSAHLIDFLIDFSKNQPCVFLRGNHDELFCNYLKTNAYNEMWLEHGGQSSIDAYKTLSSNKKEEHIFFLENLDNYYLDKKNRLFVHAGFTNLKGVTLEHFPKLLYWDRTLWEMALALNPNLNVNDKNYPPRLKMYHEIFIGHTTVTKINETTPQQRANIWNIDTGAAFKGPVSVLEIESKTFWQSKPVYLHYPLEKGRNK